MLQKINQEHNKLRQTQLNHNPKHYQMRNAAENSVLPKKPAEFAFLSTLIDLPCPCLKGEGIQPLLFSSSSARREPFPSLLRVPYTGNSCIWLLRCFAGQDTLGYA